MAQPHRRAWLPTLAVCLAALASVATSRKDTRWIESATIALPFKLSATQPRAVWRVTIDANHPSFQDGTAQATTFQLLGRVTQADRDFVDGPTRCAVRNEGDTQNLPGDTPDVAECAIGGQWRYEPCGVDVDCSAVLIVTLEAVDGSTFSGELTLDIDVGDSGGSEVAPESFAITLDQTQLEGERP